MDADLDFVSEPTDDHLCPICTKVLTKPFLTDCGHYLCYTCRDHLLGSGKNDCPECRDPNGAKDARLNKHLQRQVNSLKVHCRYYKDGCDWVGELNYLEKHLHVFVADSSIPRTECGFIPLVCPLGCDERVRSSAMEEHTKHDCMYVCEHCGYYNKREIVTEKHYPLCEFFPMECPNRCSIEKLKRNQFEMHLEQCPLQVIQCPFTSAGCTVQLPRREMEQHEENAMRQHLRMVMNLQFAKPKHAQKPRAPSLTVDDSQYLFNLTPVEFTIKDVLELKKSNTEWVSPPFYTHPHGYKVCLIVYPNGIESGSGSHMSVFVGLMKGNYDDQLKWPVEMDIAIELLNWREDNGHHERTVTINSEYYRVSKNDIWMSPCEVQFIHHSALFSSTTAHEYLNNSRIQFRVNPPYIVSTPSVIPAPSWQNPHDVSQSLCEFILTEFSKRKQSNNQFYSPPFLTHDNGYKMCLRVHANGYRSGKSTHISVYVQLMAGKNDDKLQWPFDGDIVFELLNWRADRNHYCETVSISAISDFVKLAKHKGTIGASFGHYETIPLLSLRNCTAGTEYICKELADSVRFRVKQVAVYSAPPQLRTPSSNGQQLSVCEFTLTEFSKRKQLDNKFYSPPFYTHQHGYKLCLGVNANGYSRGKGTHVSVYVKIMPGEYDENLNWPFVGKMEIELLNRRNESGHRKKPFPISVTDNYCRVLEGDFGMSRGDHLFISHSSLTEYLQDDCLRFRVNL